MNDGKYFGLTASQLNLAFFVVVGAVALAGFVYVGGVGAVREYLGDEEPTTQPAVQATATAEPTEEPEARAGEPAPQVTILSCTQLAVGCEAVVVNTGGVGLNVRNTPGLGGIIVRQLKDGDVVSIMGGPVNRDGYTWWEIPITQSAAEWAAEGDTDGTRWLSGNGRLSCQPYANSGGTAVMVWTDSPECEAECVATGGEFVYRGNGVAYCTTALPVWAQQVEVPAQAPVPPQGLKLESDWDANPRIYEDATQDERLLAWTDSEIPAGAVAEYAFSVVIYNNNNTSVAIPRDFMSLHFFRRDADYIWSHDSGPYYPQKDITDYITIAAGARQSFYVSFVVPTSDASPIEARTSLTFGTFVFFGDIGPLMAVQKDASGDPVSSYCYWHHASDVCDY